MKNAEYTRIAQAVGRAAAPYAEDSTEIVGIAMVIHHLVGEFAAHDFSFDADGFRAEADKAYADWRAQAERTRRAGETLATLASYRGTVI